jgi:dTDP-4-dehydrorhamnose reductase
MARILITGASGFLGHNLLLGLRSSHELFAGYYSNQPAVSGCNPIAFDVTRESQVFEQMRRIKPDVVAHAAALSRPDECETNPEGARNVIVEGTRHVAHACREEGARLVHISTDLVFDGSKGNYTEEDEVRGISVYSRSKIEAEDIVRGSDPAAVVLRVAVLYGTGSPAYPGYIESVLRQWRRGEPVTFYTDQYRSPTFAPQAAECINKLLRYPEVCGILHLGGADRVSRFDFGVLMARQVGAPASLLRPGSMWDAVSAAPRGSDCSLVSARIERVVGLKPMSCADGLKVLLQGGRTEA